MAETAAGRPRLEFDLDQVEKLAAMQCTQREIAAVLGCSRETVQNRIKDDEGFCAAFYKGKEGGKASLRRAQWKNALNGNTTMQIFLGKQYLGQSDKVETEYRGSSTLVIAPDDSTP